MARYKPIHTGLKLLPVDFDQQVIPGSFEHALCHLVDHELDLTAFHARYKNDDEGAPAFDPAALIKIILLAYSRGIISSRKMERACRENVLFIAVSGDSQPHFTTLAGFVFEMGEGVVSLRKTKGVRHLKHPSFAPRSPLIRGAVRHRNVRQLTGWMCGV